jgi:hypothetical protein
MKHFGIRQGSLVGQSGEGTPTTMLRQQLDKQIARMCRRQQLQQLHTEHLRWTEAGVPTLPWLAPEKVVDKSIIQVRRKHQGNRACLRQSFHTQKTTRKNQLRPLSAKTPFFMPNNLSHNDLQLFQKHPLKGRWKRSRCKRLGSVSAVLSGRIICAGSTRHWRVWLMSRVASRQCLATASKKRTVGTPMPLSEFSQGKDPLTRLPRPQTEI